jgi:parallel beta-helix repeat protein
MVGVPFCGLIILLSLGLVAQAGEELIPHVPIEILGDTAFTPENGVVAGTGTHEDPYLIEGWSIDATGVPFGIHVEGTTKAFTIEACRVFGASSTAIDLVDVRQASVNRCQLEGSFYGLALEKVQQARITGNVFSENEYAGLFLLNTTDNDLCGNRFYSGGAGILFYEKAMNNRVYDNIFDHCRIGISILSFAGGGNRIYHNDFLSCRAASEACNLWDDGHGVGNYWSDYGKEDVNGDGIGDSPYRIFGSGYEYDYHPVMTPFH